MKFIQSLLIALIFNSALFAYTQVYTGNILDMNKDCKYPIVMKLDFKDDHMIVGYYYYEQYKTKIAIKGTYTDDTFELKAADEVFTGAIFKNELRTKIVGVWKKRTTQYKFIIMSTTQQDNIANTNVKTSAPYGNIKILIDPTATSKSSIISNKALATYIEHYTTAEQHKAFAQSLSGAWSYAIDRPSTRNATLTALGSCQYYNKFNEKLPCKIINLDDKWGNELTH